MIKSCLLAVSAFLKQKVEDLDLVRHVVSDYDPVTGKERIWHVYDKGQKPSSLESPELAKTSGPSARQQQKE